MDSGGTIIGQTSLVDTGSTLASGLVSVRAFYQDMGNTEGVGYVLDNFEYTLAPDSGEGIAVGNKYVAVTQGSEDRQRASIDFQLGSNVGNDWNPGFSINLNWNGASDQWLSANTYRLDVRLDSPTWEMRVAKFDSAGDEEITTGWLGLPGGNLAYNTWYKMTIERDSNSIVGMVTSQDETVSYGTLIITDTGTPLTGGWTAITDVFASLANELVLDNFKYQLGDGPQYCSDSGTIYLDADMDQNCYVNISDVSVLALQWLWCSDPTESNCDPYWP